MSDTNANIRSWRDIKGPFSDEDVRFVQRVCDNIKGGHVVELGCLRGRSTAAMAEVCAANETKLTTVDNFKGGELGGRSTVVQQKEDAKSQFLTNMASCGFGDLVELIHGDSAESTSQFEDQSVDFCFIDADHREEYVARDIAAWWPKIRLGGCIGGHDFGNERQGVGAAVTTFARGQSLPVERHGRCWLIRKDSQT